MTETNLSAPDLANSNAFLTDKSAFAHTAQVAAYFSKSKMIPAAFHNKPEDCLVVLMMAQQLEVNPLLCFQNMNVIHGRPSFSSAFAIGLANKRGPFAGPLTWTTKKELGGLEVTCHAVIKQTGEPVEVSVDMEMAQKAGWTKNPIYKSIPEQMLRYRSATWLIRLYCPEVLCGLNSDDEIIDVTPDAAGNSGKPTEGLTKMNFPNAQKISNDVISTINAKAQKSKEENIEPTSTKPDTVAQDDLSHRREIF